MLKDLHFRSCGVEFGKECFADQASLANDAADPRYWKLLSKAMLAAKFGTHQQDKIYKIY